MNVVATSNQVTIAKVIQIELSDDCIKKLADALKQKTGKWQKYKGRFDYDWGCSECGCSSYEKTDYCPNCGARMECEEE